MSRTAQPIFTARKSRLTGTQQVIKPVNLQLPALHPKQHEFVRALDVLGRRFVVGACGTKFGKTYGSTVAMVERAWTVEDSLNWWIAPVYKQSEMAFNKVCELLPQGLFKQYNADLIIEILTPGGKKYSTIEFKSGEDPNNLRGFGVSFFIMDEAARVKYDSWVSLLTTVTQTMGKGFLISTPHARNWFYDIFKQGEKTFADGTPKYKDPSEDPHPEWWSMRMPTWANPTVKTQAIIDLRKNMPEDVFRQEVAAQFMKDSAGVFRGINECVKGQLQEPIKGNHYTIGVDLARLKDYTVLTVLDSKLHVVYQNRFNKISWELQKQEIVSTMRKYPGKVVMDTTGIGDPIHDDLRTKGVVIEGYKISGPTAKKALIDKLRVNMENGLISFPEELRVMRRELESYEYEISENGVVKFSAPSGQHDDTVISLALANWGADQPLFEYRFSNHRGI